MTDIKEKLKQLKKEREARLKSQRIRDAWEQIGKKEKLTTKEKLQQLINLTDREKPKKPKIQRPELVEREPLLFKENQYDLNHKYGKITLSSGLDIGGDTLACLSKDPAFKNLDLSTSLFIDLETTGLSGGAGVVPFNVGMGYYSDDRFWVVQYFLGDLAEEEKMIHELGKFFTDRNFQSVVTYNGKAFDIPLLETRFILYRQPLILSGLPHLDFLFPARSLWKHKYESCRLCNLAHEVLKTGRLEDIPSSEIPWRYFQYLDTGNFELIEPILYHNEEDILSLLGVVIAGALVFSEEKESDAMDLFGAGKILERAGETEKSVYFYERALDGKLTVEVSIQTKKRLSYNFKRNQEWEKAVSLWKEVASLDDVSSTQLFSFRELAMYFEHRERAYEEARKIAEEGFVLSLNCSPHYKKDFSHRLERLKWKIKRSKQ